MPDDDPKNLAERHAIQDARQKVRTVRSRCNRAINRNHPVPHAQLRQAILDYHDVLVEHKSEVTELWEENGLDDLPELAREKVPVEVEQPGYGAHSTTEMKPKIATIDVWELIEYSHALDSVAKELGFAASTKRQVHNDEADMDDLRGLLQSRGQEDALENLPEGDV